jgi:hypothetical protein
VVCATDLYEEDAEMERLLTRLRAASGEVLLLHLMAGNELNFSFRGAVTFEDLETGQRLQLNADQQRATWQQQLQEWLRATAQQARRHGFDYHQLSTAEPLDKALREFLRRREAVG